MPTGISRVKGTEAMNISLQQFAAMNMVYNRYSFSYFLDSMQRLNVSNFELWTGAPHLNCMFQTMADAASVRKSVRERGLHMVCLTPEQVMYPYNIAAVNPELRQKSLDYFHRYIDMTAELEIRAFPLFRNCVSEIPGNSIVNPVPYVLRAHAFFGL